jgi:pimeloyl-ACP methyl ester carboxylesterase
MERIMRRMTGFTCEGAWCAATLDEGNAAPGLLIVSGGNEIRSGAHAGQAAMAAHFAGLGYPVFRYDRRGIGDSEGENGGFEASAADISAAVAAFRAEAPHVTRIIAFGNCDAATSLAFFHAGLGIDRLLLANPWVIEASGQTADEPTPPSAAAVRAPLLGAAQESAQSARSTDGEDRSQKTGAGFENGCDKRRAIAACCPIGARTRPKHHARDNPDCRARQHRSRLSVCLG